MAGGPRSSAKTSQSSGGLASRGAQTGQGLVTRLQESGEVVGGTTYLNADAYNRRVEIGFTWVTSAWQRTAETCPTQNEQERASRPTATPPSSAPQR